MSQHYLKPYQLAKHLGFLSGLRYIEFDGPHHLLYPEGNPEPFFTLWTFEFKRNNNTPSSFFSEPKRASIALWWNEKEEKPMVLRKHQHHIVVSPLCLSTFLESILVECLLRDTIYLKPENHFPGFGYDFSDQEFYITQPDPRKDHGPFSIWRYAMSGERRTMLVIEESGKEDDRPGFSFDHSNELFLR